ncbi:MAG: holo-ACP synthase [Gammaproteobacteria bacterium]
MIYGVGVDLVEIARVRAGYARFGAHFARRILMPEELAGFEQSRNPVRFLATRFAAKEAIVKALGTGFHHGVWLRDVGHVPDAWGKPCVIFSPRGRTLCERLGTGLAFVSLSDEAGLVLAFAVILKKVATG